MPLLFDLAFACRACPSGLVVGARRGELQRMGTIDLLGSIEKFDGNKLAGFVIINDQAVARFVAISNLAGAENNRERIGFPIVNHLHDSLQYFLILLVL